MQYLFSQFALWLAAALVLGLIVGFWAARRLPFYRSADGRLWIFLYLVLIVIGAVIAAVQVVKDMNGLWFETLILFTAAYLIGCLIGAALRGEAGSKPDAERVDGEQPS